MPWSIIRSKVLVALMELRNLGPIWCRCLGGNFVGWKQIECCQTRHWDVVCVVVNAVQQAGVVTEAGNLGHEGLFGTLFMADFELCELERVMVPCSVRVRGARSAVADWNSCCSWTLCSAVLKQKQDIEQVCQNLL